MKTNADKKVAAFDQVVGLCNELGSAYSPPRESMTIQALNGQLSTVRAILANAELAKTRYVVAVNTRNSVFRPIPGIMVRIARLIAVSDVDEEVIADVHAISKTFRHPKVKKKPATGEAAEADTSRGPISQLDFESKIRNFKAMIALLENTPQYRPAEADLQITVLQDYSRQMVESHNAVMHTFRMLKSARTDRNRAVMGEKGIHESIINVKKYLFAAFGAQSAVYMNARKIKLSNL